MQSRFNILSALYRILNVPEIKGVITGKVYIGAPPFDGQKEDISINLINNPNRYLQKGFGNVNIHIPKLGTGRDDLKRFQELTEIILPKLEDAKITTEKGSFFFQIDDDKGIFNDEDRDGVSYYNLRFEYQTI
jgi:hypothetical protein